MKSKDFGQFLETFKDLLAKAGANETSLALNQLLPLFHAKPDVTMNQVCKTISSIKPTENNQGHCVSVVINIIPELVLFLEKLAKKTYITDANNFSKSLKSFSNFSVENIVELTIEEFEKKPISKGSKLRTDLIAKYVSKLVENLGDPNKFPEIVGEIEKGQLKFSVAEIKAIATEFSKQSISDVNNKTKAIKAINRRHEALMIGKAKSDATGSTIAA